MANSIPNTPGALLTRGRTAEALIEAGFPVKAKTLATKATRGGGPPYKASSTGEYCIAGSMHGLSEGTSDCATPQLIRTRLSRAITRRLYTRGDPALLEALKMTIVKRNWVAAHARLMTFDRLTNTIDALVKAHNAYLVVCNESCEERDDGSFATDAEIDAAFDARADVIVELIAAQMAYCQAHLSPGSGAGTAARWCPSLPLEPTSLG